MPYHCVSRHSASSPPSHVIFYYTSEHISNGLTTHGHPVVRTSWEVIRCGQLMRCSIASGND